MDQAELFLLDQMPLAQRSLIPTTLKTAYAAAIAHIEATPFLMVPSVQRGRIIQWAVDHGFAGLIQSGQWNADCRWRHFEKPTGQYLEIILSHSVVTISQVSEPEKQPRDVRFRANRRLRNQGWLKGLPDPTGKVETSGVPHVLLVHGHQDLNFAHLGIPNEDHAKGYIYRSPNLMLMPHEVESPLHPVEDTDFDAVMTLKEEIDKWRRDNANDA